MYYYSRWRRDRGLSFWKSTRGIHGSLRHLCMLGRSTRFGIGVLLAASWPSCYHRSDQTLGDPGRKGLSGVCSAGWSHTTSVWSSFGASGSGTVTCSTRAKSHLIHLARLGLGRVVHENSYCRDDDGTRLANTTRYRTGVQRRNQRHGFEICRHGISSASYMLFRPRPCGSLRRGLRDNSASRDQSTDSNSHR